jgi:hypothetical protein
MIDSLSPRHPTLSFSALGQGRFSHFLVAKLLLFSGLARKCFGTTISCRNITVYCLRRGLCFIHHRQRLCPRRRWLRDETALAPVTAGERIMLNDLIAETHEWYQQAAHCA